MSLHIYRERLQPATCFVDRTLPGSGIWSRYSPRRLFRAHCCGKLRWAKYVRVQVYYDGIRQWCAKGHGCKK
jgi:hypothetical protein